MIIILCIVDILIIIKRMYSKKTKLFIGGISKNITQCIIYTFYFIAELLTYFSKYCDILDCVIIIDKSTSKKANPKESICECSQSKSKYNYSYKSPSKEIIPQNSNLFIYIKNDTNSSNMLPNESPPPPIESHKTFKKYFINHIKDPHTYNYFQYKLFDITGDELSVLSPYQNNSKLNLFKSETESATNSTQTPTNKASSSSSESELNLEVNCDDSFLNGNEHQYYGPRINKIIKYNFGNNFTPY